MQSDIFGANFPESATQETIPQAVIVGESINPDEIRAALDHLRMLIGKLDSAIIRQHLRKAYVDIAAITVHSSLPSKAC